MFDLLISNGRVVDGSGNPWYCADIGIEGGVIGSLGKLSGLPAKRVIDASGLVVAPGFIDAHVHSDVMLLAEPLHEEGVRQGITTEILGQDGVSYAPLSPAKLRFLRHYLAGVNGNPDITWDWSSVAEFRGRFEGTVAINTAYLIPHGTVRLEVMGMSPRQATKGELKEMKKLVAQGMEEGAVGLSSGLTYFPGAHADTDELTELCRVVARYGGVYVTHTRGLAYGFLDFGVGDRFLDPKREGITIAERAGLPVHFSHFKAGPGIGKGRSGELLALIDGARERGIDVTIEAYPYHPGSTFLAAHLPAWVVDADEPEEILRRLRDPSIRKRIKRELAVGEGDWEGVCLTSVSSEKNEPLVGKTIAEAARSLGKEPNDLFLDLLLEEELAVGYRGLEVREEDEDFGILEQDMRKIMAHRSLMVGSDGIHVGSKPHPRAWGCFARYLGRYSRDLGVLTLEDTIRKMTSLPAQRFALHDRGLLKKGLAADIVIFDAERVADRATFEQPRQFPVGIEYVIVNGQLVIDAGEHTGTLSGRALGRNR